MLSQVQSTRSSRLVSSVSQVGGSAREQTAIPDTGELPSLAAAVDHEQRAPVALALVRTQARVDGLSTTDVHPPALGRDGEVRAFAAGLATAAVVDQTTRDDFAALVGRLGVKGTRDVNDLVQQVLRESYLSSTEDLNFYAQKVAFYNDLKKKIRTDITGLRKALSDNAGAPEDGENANNPIKFPLDAIDMDRSIVGADGVRRPNPNFGLPRYPGAAEAVSRWASIPQLDAEGRLVPIREDKVGLDLWPTKEELSGFIDDLESQLNSVGDDAQLANVDLQNMLQKQQQTLQMMSNISKVLHDTAMAVVRKISG